MTEEKEQAIRIANKILDTPYADPDSDESVLARQFLRLLEPKSSDEICESLTRHVEMSGSEAFDKTFIQGNKIKVSIWVVLGEHAARFNADCEQWMVDNGFNED